MNTQISFTADSKLKKKAMEKAKEKGLTLKSVLIFSMEAFVNDKMKLGVMSTTVEDVEDVEDVEELKFSSASINKNAQKLARLLK